MNLYVIRHGKTIWNEKGITQGRTNNRLSKRGQMETYEVAEQLRDISFDVIYTSPLTRAVQTANIINKFHNIKVVKDFDLIEIDQGIFTRRKKDSLTAEEQKLKNERSKLAKMETYEECFERVDNFLKRLKKCDFRNVLVVTHNCTATFIEDIVLSKKIDFSDDKFLRNFKNSEIKNFVI